jgi:hypothetical protein
MSAPASVDLVFRLIGESVDPARITRMTGIEPSKAHAKGDPIPGTAGGLRQSGLWLLESRLDEQESLPRHLAAMLDTVDSIADAVRFLQAEDVRAEVMVGVFLYGRPLYVPVEAGLLAKLGSLGINLELHVYESVRPEDEIDRSTAGADPP